MTHTGKCFEIEDLADRFSTPVLVISTVVGRGAYVIGEAIQQRLGDASEVHHIPIEQLVSAEVTNEDVERYRFISNNIPWLLYLVYKVPFFYYRKYLREKVFQRADLHRLKQVLMERRVRTVICVSHRPAFWTSALKRREGLPISIWGVGVEFGRNLGWQYQFWEQMTGLLSPVPREFLRLQLPDQVEFNEIQLPVRIGYRELAQTPGDANKVLLACGAWGQGPIEKVARILSEALPELEIHAACGDNVLAYEQIARRFNGNDRVRAYQTAPSLYPFLKECASVITKPGMATLLESHAANRKIFLLKGMPVAEDNNARFAVEHFGAEWFSVDAFRAWRKTLKQ